MTNATENTSNVNATENVNDTRLKDFMKDVRKYGAESAAGRDALPHLALRVVQAAADGLIDAEGTETVYEAYIKADERRAAIERTPAGRKAQISKLRQLVSLGCLTTVDGFVVITDAKEVLEKVHEKGEGKVKSAYAYFVDVARAQLKQDTPLSKEALKELAFKSEPNPKTLEGELEKVRKILEGLISGENKDKLKDDHEDVEAAYHLIDSRLKQLITLRETEELRRKAAALGFKLA